MADLKTKKNEASVTDFLNSIEDEQKRKDSFELLQLIEEITGDRATMWGKSIVGAGHYHYKYASGRENDWFPVGFSPRKNALVLYLMTGFDRYGALLEKLGKHKTGKGCLYLKKLEEVDRKVLKELVTRSVADLKQQG